jgi:hypothetical protein
MPDSVALFHATHANLAGAGAAISATTLGAGAYGMRLQKGLQSEELNLAPKYLIVPATQEQLAYQYTSSQYVPTKQSDVNEFRQGGRTGRADRGIGARRQLDHCPGTSPADNNQCDTVEYCYLEGSEGVQMSSRIGFTVDGVELKASLDFAARHDRLPRPLQEPGRLSAGSATHDTGGRRTTAALSFAAACDSVGEAGSPDSATDGEQPHEDFRAGR